MPLLAPPRLSTGNGWRELLSAWAELLDQYQQLAEQSGDPDVAYWHSEPALTGMLVSAAWQSGGAGLVEFDTKRRRPDLDASGPGLGDAYLLVGTKWYAVEAKLGWSIDEASEALNAAVTDLWSIRPADRAKCGLAVCFYTPQLSARPAAHVLEGEVRRLGERIPSATFLVGYTPIGEVPRDEDGNWWPGLVAIGQDVPWDRPFGNDPWQQPPSLSP